MGHKVFLFKKNIGGAVGWVIGRYATCVLSCCKNLKSLLSGTDLSWIDSEKWAG